MEGLVLGRRKAVPVIIGEKEWRHHYISEFADRTTFGAPYKGFYFLKDNEIKPLVEAGESEGEYKEKRRI